MNQEKQSLSKKNERIFLVQPYKRSFRNKNEAMKQIKKISSYLDSVNLYNKTKLNFLSEEEFINILESGVPHRLGACLESKMTPGDVQDYRTNLFCMDIDDLSHLPEQTIRKVISRLYENFHFVQESFSSGKKFSQKRFHCYLIVNTLQVDYEVLAFIYKRVRDDLSAKIGITFDESMYPLKNIFASGKKVKVNKTLKPFDLNPYLNDYLQKKKKLIEKKGHSVENHHVVNEIVDEQFNKSLFTSRVNFEELIKALKSEQMPAITDYNEWIRYLMAFNNMEKEGLITNEQKIELAKAIDDGNNSYKKEFEKLKRYDQVTIGSLIYRLQQNGIATNRIFTFTEKYDLRIDLKLDIQGKITDNPDVVNTIKEVLYDEKNQGKRILLIGPTGSGKSTAILEILKTMTNCRTHSNSVQGFSILCIPRLNLINNLSERFEQIPKSKTVTGSTQYTSVKRKEVIRESANILTTIDHLPTVLMLKNIKQESLEENNNFSHKPKLLLLDECHMLSTDATFKPEAIIKFSEAERNFLNSNGISLHITATPENLCSEDYDLIIEINQLNRENPFERAGYLMLDGSSKEVEKKMLEIIKIAAIKNKERRLLVFIERLETISAFSRELNNLGIKTMGVISKKEDLKSKEEKILVSKGIIPEDIQVILATTALSAGVSIENNRKVDETWIFCSPRSLNHEMTRIAQMSHRFRNTYHALKIFFQKGRPQKKKKPFLYHTFLNAEIKKAENFKMAIQLLRENQLDGRITLDELELQNGLFMDDEGELHVCTPLIQSEIVFNKTLHNINNPFELIRELERKFRCDFVEMKINGIIEIGETHNEDSKKASNPIDPKNVLKRIVNDELYFSQLKNEYFIYGKSEFSRQMKSVKKSTVNDLIHFFEQGYEFSFVSQVMKAHLNAKKGETLSYRRDLQSLKEMKKILKSHEISISKQMYKEITKHITLSANTKNPVEFGKVSEIEAYLKAVAKEILKNKGFNDDLKRVESLKKLLRIKRSKKGGNWIYTIEGFVNEEYIKEKYGINEIKY